MWARDNEQHDRATCYRGNMPPCFIDQHRENEQGSHNMTHRTQIMVHELSPCVVSRFPQAVGG